MDKLNPSFQATPVTVQAALSPTVWYGSEATAGVFTAAEVGWMHAQGWRTTAIVTSGGESTYFFSRRILRPENVLSELVSSYTAAYNEGRQLNDQRYDDLLVLYTAILDKTENTFNTQETADGTFEVLIEALIGQLGTDFTAYAADVDGDLDAWGASLLAEINARFNAELGKAQQALIDRGLYSGALWLVASAGIERERTRALNDANDKIIAAQLALKHKVYAEQEAMRTKVMASRERIRTYLSSARDRQVAARNAAAEALARLVERREDSYPDLSEVGRLAAGLGAGSPEAFSPT